MSYKPMKEGWVRKRSKYLHKWRLRWLVLTAESLSSYKSPSYGKQTLQINLEEISEVSRCLSERENCLQVITKGSRYLLQFQDETDKNNWNALIINLKKSPLRARSVLANQIFEKKSNTEIAIISVFRTIKQTLNAREAELTSEYETSYKRNLIEGQSNLVNLEKELATETEDYKAFHSAVSHSTGLMEQVRNMKIPPKTPSSDDCEAKSLSLNLNEACLNRIIRDNTQIKAVNPAEMCIRRTCNTRALKWRYTGNRIDCLSFQVDHNINLSAIGLCIPYKTSGETVLKTLQVLRGARSDAVVVYRHPKKEIMKHNPEASVQKIQLNRNVTLSKGTLYTVLCCMYGDSTYKCVGCSSRVSGTYNEVWNFSDTVIAPYHTNNRCDTVCGPIADFYYILNQELNKISKH